MTMNAINIIISTKATEKEIFAAQELGFYLKKILGKDITLKLVREYQLDVNVPKEFISIGETERFKSLFDLKALKDQVGEDGYKIKMTSASAYICGGAGQGTIFGVYGFLNKLFGLKIFTDDLFTFDNGKCFEMLDCEWTDKPDFPMRSLGIYPVHLEKRAPELGNKRYCYRMRLRQMDEGWGINNHTYFRILPPDIYKAEHPDWYDATGKTLCLTNEEMLAQFVENMKVVIENTPDDSLYSIGMEDCPNGCDCPNCKAQEEKYGGNASIIMLVFANKVVKALNAWLKQEYPERKIIFYSFAYTWSKFPPAIKNSDGKYVCIFEDLALEENLGVLLAPLWANANYPLNDERNIEARFSDYSKGGILVKDMFEGWKAVVKHLAIWIYNCNFYDYCCPQAMWRYLDENFKWLKTFSPQHIFMEAGTGISMANFSEMKIYCVSKLMWNAEQNLDALIDEFMTPYYGDAKDKVKEYFNAIHDYADYQNDKFGRKQVFIHFDDYPNGRLIDEKLWEKDVLEKWIKLFEDALDNRLSIKQRINVRKESLPVKLTYLELYRKTISEFEIKKLIEDIKEISELTGIDYAWDEEPKYLKNVLAGYEKELKCRN